MAVHILNEPGVVWEEEEEEEEEEQEEEEGGTKKGRGRGRERQSEELHMYLSEIHSPAVAAAAYWTAPCPSLCPPLAASAEALPHLQGV